VCHFGQDRKTHPNDARIIIRCKCRCFNPGVPLNDEWTGVVGGVGRGVRVIQRIKDLRVGSCTGDGDLRSIRDRPEPGAKTGVATATRLKTTLFTALG